MARLETTIHDLTFENANLHRENERLRALLRQLQSGEPSILDTTPEFCLGSSRPHKKARMHKNENGGTNSFDSSESAAFATSQQRNFLLAMVPTVLFLLSAAPTSVMARVLAPMVRRHQMALTTKVTPTTAPTPSQNVQMRGNLRPASCLHSFEPSVVNLMTSCSSTTLLRRTKKPTQMNSSTSTLTMKCSLSSSPCRRMAAAA